MTTTYHIKGTNSDGETVRFIPGSSKAMASSQLELYRNNYRSTLVIDPSPRSLKWTYAVEEDQE